MLKVLEGKKKNNKKQQKNLFSNDPHLGQVCA